MCMTSVWAGHETPPKQLLAVVSFESFAELETEMACSRVNLITNCVHLLVQRVLFLSSVFLLSVVVQNLPHLEISVSKEDAGGTKLSKILKNLSLSALNG